jgi:hypothetical protein
MSPLPTLNHFCSIHSFEIRCKFFLRYASNGGKWLEVSTYWTSKMLSSRAYLWETGESKLEMLTYTVIP